MPTETTRPSHDGPSLQACDANITQAQCDQLYAGVNETCKACVAGANYTDEDACIGECNL